MLLYLTYSIFFFPILFQYFFDKNGSTIDLGNGALKKKKKIKGKRTFQFNMVKKFTYARDPFDPQEYLKDIPYKDELDRIQIRGKKIEMRSIFSPNGHLMPATLIEIIPNIIYRFLDFGKVGIAYGKPLDESRWILKPEIGQIAKVGCNFKNTCSLTLTPPQNFVLGQIIDVSYLYNYKYVNVRGLSKGKGFCGVVKRWGFSRGPMSHGSKHHRKTGSIGASTHIGRVLKGKKMPGKHGNKFRTMINLKLLGLNLERNEILVSGCIPGNRNSYVTVTASKDNKVNKYKYILDLLYEQEKNVK
ncbi:50S ribosomal protein L3, apicoplast, putative [Plasmodium malariae]|uniref:Large ribosomal subunit protein uL3c n=1 Tax=Plasmodium malariae TaxID=5858 RepID=A0A1C3KBK6_PLAMA|nr:50S ribosomal protein L3, apicoplast, putative [Plasmodium malariae]